MTSLLHRRTPAALALGLLFVLQGAQAQTQAPGLWEHSFTIKSQSGAAATALAGMQQQLASMPPEQRAQIEQMMKKNGVTLGANGGTATTVKVCLSKEDAAKPPEARLPAGCTQDGTQRSGSTIRFKFACTRPQLSSGEGEVTFAGDKAYSGRSTMTTQVAGAPQQVALDLSGKWIAADCGDLKPRAVAAP